MRQLSKDSVRNPSQGDLMGPCKIFPVGNLSNQVYFWKLSSDLELALGLGLFLICFLAFELGAEEDKVRWCYC